MRGSKRCFSFQFYIKPQLLPEITFIEYRCFSFQFYIKPQLFYTVFNILKVVSHSNSTSNHNSTWGIAGCLMLFLIPILHQTTTEAFEKEVKARCFSFQFYIKPQRPSQLSFSYPRCFSFQFYIKPQQKAIPRIDNTVVSHSNSTSNHNLAHGSNSYSARYTYDTDA